MFALLLAIPVFMGSPEVPPEFKQFHHMDCPPNDMSITCETFRRDFNWSSMCHDRYDRTTNCIEIDSPDSWDAPMKMEWEKHDSNCEFTVLPDGTVQLIARNATCTWKAGR